MAKTRLSAAVLIFIFVISLVFAILSLTIFSTEEQKPNTSDPIITENSRTSPTPTAPPSTFSPSKMKSTSPTFNPSSIPSALQIVSTRTLLPTSKQSEYASDFQSYHPSVTDNSSPSLSKRDPPSLLPSKRPSDVLPSNPSGCRRATGSNLGCKHVSFYAIADVPYTDKERAELPGQILSIPDNADFLIHLGDIRSARDGEDCKLGDFRSIADTLKRSSVPVFLVMGGEYINLAFLAIVTSMPF